MLQPQRDRRFEKAKLVAAIESPAGKAQPVKGLTVLDQPGERVSQLNLSAAAGFAAGKVLEDLRLYNIAADDRRCRRGHGRLRLFDDTARPHQPAVVGDDIEYAIAARLLARDFDDRGEVAAGLAIGVDHLRQAWRLTDHQIVGEQYGKRFVADQPARAPHGVAEAERHLLPGIGDLAGFWQPRLQLFEQIRLAPLAQGRFELEGAVEMILDRTFRPARDKKELLDTRCLRLLDRVMDQRFVDDRQHFLGHRLGCREKPGPEPGDREDSFADALVHERLDDVLRWPRKIYSIALRPTNRAARRANVWSAPVNPRASVTRGR